MVMAAGAGTRLRPLTYALPKPMVPIANRPVLEYTLENLKRHGIQEVVLNLHSHPALIRDHFKDGAAWGLKIRYSLEPELLGTAGGVKKVESFLKKGTFLVMSGDGLTDVNLTELLAFHRSRRSVGTMALKPLDTRFEYGITMTDPGGRITRFVEKPRWSDVFSNQVNTGIYVFEPSILSRIPKGRVYDFGLELWPALLKERQPIHGYVLQEYWCDVGNLHEYRRAQCDALEGKAGIQLPGRPIQSGVWVGEGTVIEPGARLEAPCLIGKRCHIAREAVIGAYTVIGDRARISRRCVLQNCILWNDVHVERQVRLENCVIGHHARVTENISVYEGSVINLSG